MADTVSMWRSKCNNKYLKSDIEKWDKQLKSELVALRKLPHNRRCFDCGSDDTTWASPKLGIFICVACSDVHRAAGAHITCVKNFNTYLWGPDEVGVMKAVGNKVGQCVYGNAKERRDESSDSASTSTRGVIQNQQHSHDSNDDWLDSMLGSKPISLTTSSASASRAKQPAIVEACLQQTETKKATDWFDLLGSMQLTAEKMSVSPKVRAEKGRPVATVLVADDELDLFFDSLA